MKPHLGLVNSLSKDVMSLLTDMLLAEWEGTHTCDSEEDIVECRFCELSSLWHQLAAKLVEWIVPEKELEIPEKDLPKIEDAQHRTFTEKNRGDSRDLLRYCSEKHRTSLFSFRKFIMVLGPQGRTRFPSWKKRVWMRWKSSFTSTLCLLT